MKKTINFAENRNVYLKSLKLKKALTKSCKIAFEYPDYKNTKVNSCISNYFNIPKENLTVTNGSLEGINLLVEVLKKENSFINIPTFWGYEDALNRYGYDINKEKLNDDLYYNYETINNNAKKYKLIILCNPNNPTLSYIPKTILINIIKNNPQCHFIVDETMLIFDEEYDKKTITKEVVNYNNLSVVVSFSKVLGIAGLRIGALFSNQEIVNAVKKTNIPYSLGIIQQNILPVVLSEKDKIESSKKLISINKEKLTNKLMEMGCEVIDGKTNFVLVKLPKKINANELTNYLYNSGLEVRNIKEAYPELVGDWLRISIQTPVNNKKLIKKMNCYFRHHNKENLNE